MIAKRASMLSFDLDASPAAVEKAESVIGREVVSKSSGEVRVGVRGRLPMYLMATYIEVNEWPRRFREPSPKG
jgi:hypothetical protein